MQKILLAGFLLITLTFLVSRDVSAGSSSWIKDDGNLIYLGKKVGLGTSTPLKKLHVEGSFWIGRPGGSDLSIITPPGSIRLNSHGADVIFNQGKVGIGTLNPTRELTVNGTIRAKEIIVDSGWADYVFDREYQLMSISNLARFISLNKKLPGLPSQSEVISEGVGLSQVTTKLLEKIEEQALYIIQLDQRINSLEEYLLSVPE